jgi:hypothetical protein
VSDGREVPISRLGFLSAFFCRSCGAIDEDDGASAAVEAFFGLGAGSVRGAGARGASRLLVPGMTSCGLVCGAGAFWAGCDDGLGSLWTGGGVLRSGAGGGGVRVGGARSRCRARAAASSLSAVSSCGEAS